MPVWETLPAWAQKTLIIVLALLLILPHVRELVKVVCEIAQIVIDFLTQFEDDDPEEIKEAPQPAEQERYTPQPPPQQRQRQGVFALK